MIFQILAYFLFFNKLQILLIKNANFLKKIAPYFHNKSPQVQELISLQTFDKKIQGGFFRKICKRACTIIGDLSVEKLARGQKVIDFLS